MINSAQFYGLLFFVVAFAGSMDLDAQHDRKTLKNHRKSIQYSIDKQTVLVSLDTIFDKGRRYGIITRNLQMRNDFDVRTLSNNNVFFITSADAAGGFLNVKFLDGSFRMASIPSTFGIDRIAEFIVRENLLNYDGINEEVIPVFMTKYPLRERRSLLQNIVEDVSTAVDNTRRNRQERVYESGSNLMQGGFLIGSFEKKNENFGTDVKRVIYIYHTDGGLCAKAIFDMGNPEVSLFTARDQKEHFVNIKGIIKAENVARYLVQWNYL
jgi:hypothetical protein